MTGADVLREAEPLKAERWGELEYVAELFGVRYHPLADFLTTGLF